VITVAKFNLFLSFVLVLLILLLLKRVFSLSYRQYELILFIIIIFKTDMVFMIQVDIILMKTKIIIELNQIYQHVSIVHYIAHNIWLITC